jgi:hypothetical protein
MPPAIGITNKKNGFEVYKFLLQQRKASINSDEKREFTTSEDLPELSDEDQ